MGIFGSDYPPGCHSVPGDEPCICEVCGRDPDDCECPECPVCGEVGRLECYGAGKTPGRGRRHLDMTIRQAELIVAAEEAAEREAEAADAAAEKYNRGQVLESWDGWECVKCGREWPAMTAVKDVPEFCPDCSNNQQVGP